MPMSMAQNMGMDCEGMEQESLESQHAVQTPSQRSVCNMCFSSLDVVASLAVSPGDLSLIQSVTLFPFPADHHSEDLALRKALSSSIPPPLLTFTQNGFLEELQYIVLLN